MDAYQTIWTFYSSIPKSVLGGTIGRKKAMVGALGVGW